MEFQQLKQQIVQISNNTEWNGFPVLNGTAGQQVGEMPVFKATSKNQFGSVFIDPTSTRTVAGAGAGEQQTFTLTGTPAQGDITIAGQKVSISSTVAANGLAAVMTDIQRQLRATDYFATNSGRTVSTTATLGELVITYNGTDGDKLDTPVTTGSTNLTPVVDPVTGSIITVNRAATTGAQETFKDNGKFSQSGSLSFSFASGSTAVTANFLTIDNKTIALTGTLAPATGVVTFLKSAGLNKSVITDDLTYTLQDSTGAPLDLTAAPRALSMNVDVSGSIPAMHSGDLKINDVVVGPSLASDDLLSPRNNAAGSAIAKAAAINRLAVDQGIKQGESQAITFSGTPMPGTITVAGVSVEITNADKTPADAAAKIAAALQASPQFGASTNRNVTHAQGSTVVSVDFPVTEGDVPLMDVAPGSTGMGSVVNTTAPYLTSVPGTGVFAKVNENVFTGKAQSGTSAVSGVVYINGYASADIASVLNNPQATRAAVTRAINLISDKTGVKAIDTGSESKGISLVAADGRNIEVRFDTKANAEEFGNRIGMREGVQSSTISLESKIQAPIVLTSSSTGDISRAGLEAGNYSKNESVLNTQARATVQPAISQVNSVNITPSATALTPGAVTLGETVSVVVNGIAFTSDATKITTQDVRDSLISKINANKTLGVFATAGKEVGEVLLTAVNPGTSFTMTTAKSIGATVNVASKEVVPNGAPQTKNLGMDDLVINGVKIRPSVAADDKYSNTVATSSDPSASALALAAAINASTSQTGVRAEANPVISQGSNTVTGVPLSNSYSLWVNGTEVPVDFTQGEPGTARRQKVVDALNIHAGQTGVKAVDNGTGVTLTTDGRNLSVWFDSSIKDLSAASFGLDKGGAVAQVSKIKLAGGASVTPSQSVVINGVTVTGAPTASANVVNSALALRDAINAKTELKNVVASIDPNDTAAVLITSAVAGSGFDIRGAAVDAGSTQTLTISTVTANDSGKTDVTAVDLSASYSTNVLGGANAAANVKTQYGSVKLISDAPMLPAMPGPDGRPPSLLGVNGTPILITSGADGFGPQSNFSALGFQEGTFGGRASEDMDPPKVGRLAFQVGASANQIVTIDLADFGQNGAITGQITGDVDLPEEQRKVRINTSQGATAVLNLLDAAMDKVNATRATMGAVMNRLDHVVSNLTNVSMNMSTSRSQIEDADYAASSTELAKTQIMQQAATAVLAQANTSQQSVLKLLGN